MALLGREDILTRKNEIFRNDCFDEASLRAAAYDLRLSAQGEIDTTGRVDRHRGGAVLILAQGQRAVLQTLETIAMPWNLAGNIGVKYRMGIKGIFVSPGLFVDPGFGWRRNDHGDLEPTGGRLRFMVTNVGQAPVSIRLGAGGDNVIGVQFFDVPEPAANDREPVFPVDIDPQGLAFFDRLTQMSQSFEKVEKVAERTATATDLCAVQASCRGARQRTVRAFSGHPVGAGVRDATETSWRS
jgi:deoxycytidine triphosphate deaminase